MEHEVVIQLPAELVQPALADPALLARCVPGLSTDASDTPERRTAAKRSAATGPEEINGRLRVRIGGSTITYRGVVSLIRSGGSGVLTAFAEGQEARGDGEVVATLRLRVEPTGTGDEAATVLRFSGDLTPGGRLAELDEEALAVAGRRLLDRFAAALGAELKGTPVLTVVPDDERDDDGRDEREEDEEDGDELPDDLFADDLSDLIAFSPSPPPSRTPTATRPRRPRATPTPPSPPPASTSPTATRAPSRSRSPEDILAARSAAASSAAPPRRSTTPRRAAATPRRCPPAAPAPGPPAAGTATSRPPRRWPPGCRGGSARPG